ncbi:myo-inosose-2 dehydratase [Clostridium botulinum]|uniref:Inosose dehydratase n=2 Tax=Clostridium botulinum TaxID=1491 RepID=IOLE_CLOBA|nr:myo-inosose-2 dehydratase [Clostridium botulinum]B2V4K2.1 RecName: Full=Inosose dehydratase; AltName: Full=2-keto-myo-inositol dehydratase; Short=2KMI dehydratase [Clostridium botulinum E3 str. Alaska E43]ACD53876.1 inosose dehydratase [Clostridium botulinum E3 str. Alaska E43]AJF29267.1 inosose dehydratase [Clostridium botulinum]AJF32328.1 inosose dehydratase [Clostridium botulinum]KAI3350998.1 myo-inosose-2 dehydratase [Clostridium botulinum]KOM87766.1 inosose dehydratase [Clostridium bo
MFNSDKVKIGICPIGWTNDDMPDLGKENTFEQAISEMALAGFKGTEIGNKYPKDVKVLKKALEMRNLQIASAWFSSFLTTKPYEETEKEFIAYRDFLHAMGSKVIVVSEQGHSIQGQMETPIFDGKYHFNEEEWNLLANGLNKLGQLAADKGMKIVYHHHMGTGVQTTEEIDKLMSVTDENLVYLLFDTGHLVYSGENPVEILKKYVHRIKHVHLKDIRPEIVSKVKNEKLSFLKGVRAGAFTVPGDGSIDFEPIFKILAENNYEGWLMIEAEQDPSIANPLEYAIKGRQYIKEKASI